MLSQHSLTANMFSSFCLLNHLYLLMNILASINSCTITLITLLMTHASTHVTTHVITHGDSYLVDPRPYLVYKDPCRETCLSGSFFCIIQVVPNKSDCIPFSPYCPQYSIGLRLIFSPFMVFQLHVQRDALCED